MLITISDKEIQCLDVLQDFRNHCITQVRAAEILNLSTRQITQLLHKFNQNGVLGMAHATRGQPDHLRHDDVLKSKCLSIISEHLLGFGPTLSHEQLSSMFALDVPVETLRRWMTANELWIPRSKRLKRPYQPRYNRDCYGELIQIDGSHHDWFEGRAPKCCLLVYIDDATGNLLHLRFCEAETTFDLYFRPKPILNNTASHWPFVVTNIRCSESIKNPVRTARSRNLGEF